MADDKIMEKETTLNNLLKSIAIEQKYTDCHIVVKPAYDLGGRNAMIYMATITAPNRNDLKLFVKASIYQEQKLDSFYFIEHTVYTLVIRTFEWLQDKHNIRGYDRVVFPKFYGSNPKEKDKFIVLEDLTVSNLVNWDIFESVNWKFAAKAVEELAKFHALSLAYKEEDFEGYKKLMKHMEHVANKQLWGSYIEKAIAMAIQVTKDENKSRLLKFIKQHSTEESKLWKPLLRPVLRLCDYHTNNLMYNDYGNDRMHMTIIDFQLVKTGSGVADLITFMFANTDLQFRKNYYDQLVELYYTQICAALKRFGIDPDQSYPREDFEFELKELFPFGVVVAVFFLPGLLGKLGKSNSGDVEDLILEPTTTLVVRLNDIIDQYVSWGVL